MRKNNHFLRTGKEAAGFASDPSLGEETPKEWAMQRGLAALLHLLCAAAKFKLSIQAAIRG
jgi:hypothetical protein